MNRTLRWALLAAFAVIAVPSYSQSVSSTSQDAWAVSALGKMQKSGLIKDMPASVARDGKMPSRLEIAVAAHSAYSKLHGYAQGLGGARNRLEEAILKSDDAKDPIFRKEDYEALRAILGEAKVAGGAIRELAENTANLARMAAEFEEELAYLGVDVEAMRKELASLANRVSKLEQDELPFDLDVEWNLISLMGHSRGGNYGLTVDGRPTGVRRNILLGGGSNAVGMSQDVSVGHELALGFSGETNPIKWKGTLVAGNLVGGAAFANSSSDFGLFGSQGSILYDTPFSDSHQMSVYLQNFELQWDGAIAGKDANIRAGRVSYQGIPYVFRRQDTTPYYINQRWDDHNYYFDGAVIQFPFANGSKLDVFGGRQSNRQASKETFFNGMFPMTVGELQIEDGNGDLDVAQHLGLAYWQKPTKNFSYALNYIFLEGDGNATFNNSGRTYDRMELFGFDGRYRLSDNCGLNFGKAESTYKRGRGTVVGGDNRAYWANVDWTRGRASGNVGWRQIDPNYGAPGDWGRMGINWRAPDHKGWFKRVNYFAGPMDSFSLETFEAQGMNGGHNEFQEEEKMRSINFDWRHRLTGKSTMILGYEQFRAREDGDDARFSWFRVGVDHDLGSGSFFRMIYESSNASADDGIHYAGDYGNRRRGGLFSMQLGRRY